MPSLPPCSCTEGLNPDCERHGLSRRAHNPSGPQEQRIRRSRRPRQVSEAQKLRTAYLNGSKGGKIQSYLDEYGVVACNVDGCSVRAETFEEAWELLDLHHEVKRSKGHGYRDWSDLGVDAPWHTTLVCRPHHDELEGKPMFSRKEPA